MPPKDRTLGIGSLARDRHDHPERYTAAESPHASERPVCPVCRLTCPQIVWGRGTHDDPGRAELVEWMIAWGHRCPHGEPCESFADTSRWVTHPDTCRECATTCSTRATTCSPKVGAPSLQSPGETLRGDTISRLIPAATFLLGLILSIASFAALLAETSAPNHQSPYGCTMAE